MTDIISSDWAELDASNSNPSPNGVQGGYAPSTVAPTIRAIRGAVKRAYVQANALVTTTGTGSAYLLTYGAAPESYAKGVVIRFYAHTDNTGACSLNINSHGPKSILSQHGVALTAGQIKAGQLIEVAYNGTSFQIISNEVHDAKFTGNSTFAALSGNGSGITGLNGSNIATGTVDDVRLPISQAGKTFTTAVTVRNGTGGYLQLQPGDATFTGFAEFRLNDGARLGFIGYANNSTKQIMLIAEAGASFNFTGEGKEPTVHGNKIWHAGNGGAGSGLAADTVDGYHVREDFTANSIVARNASGNIAARDGVFGRDTNDGYVHFGTNALSNIGSDGTYIRTSGLPFRVNGNASVTGQLDVVGGIYSTGALGAGDARMQVDGNITFKLGMATAHGATLYDALNARVKNDGGTYAINIVGNAGNAQALNSQNAAYYTNIPARLGYTPANLAGANFTGNIGVGTTPAGTWIGSGRVIAIGDSDTGIRQGGDGILQLFANNQERMRVDSNAYFMNVGDLQVNGVSVVRNDGGTWTINITGSAASVRNTSGNPFTFAWSGQSGQPSWLWGGNDANSMYVYNPSNFSVDNAAKLNGVSASNYVQRYTGNVANETDFPIGHTIVVYTNGATLARNTIVNAGIGGGDTNFYRIMGSGQATTALSGTYRARGHINSDYVVAQRNS